MRNSYEISFPDLSINVSFYISVSAFPILQNAHLVVLFAIVQLGAECFGFCCQFLSGLDFKNKLVLFLIMEEEKINILFYSILFYSILFYSSCKPAADSSQSVENSRHLQGTFS
jgi:hypothetical protein